jgi:hypothetical protein
MTFITTIKLELLFLNIEYTLFPDQTRIYQGTFSYSLFLPKNEKKKKKNKKQMENMDKCN